MTCNTKLRKRSGPGKTISQHWQMLLMAVPAVVLLFLFAYMPMFGTVIAFKRYKVKLGIFGSPWGVPGWIPCSGILRFSSVQALRR